MKFEHSVYTNDEIGFKQLSLDLLNKSYSIYKTRLRELQEQYSEESVHFFRVSSRRFLESLILLNRFFPSLYYTKIIKAVKKQLNSLSRLRDLQVMSLASVKMKIKYPIIFEYINYLNQLEFEEVNYLKAYFEQVDPDNFDDFIYFIGLNIRTNRLNELQSFDNFRTIILNDYHHLLEWKDKVDTNITRTIHQLRIRNKKFRYLIELSQPVFKQAKKIVKVLSTQQNKMGAIQDNSVFINEFASFISENRNIEPLLKPILEDLYELNIQLISNFAKSSVILNNLIYFNLDEK
jgi:CHAD domain-containing protein